MSEFKGFNFNFMAQRKLALSVSALLLIISLGSLFSRGLNLGIDFTGGTLVEIGYQEAADLNDIRERLGNSDFKDAVVQNFGTPRDVLIRLAASSELAKADVSSKVLEILPGAEMRRVEFVGPQVGEELTEDGGLAILYALIGILIYVTIRFQSKFAPGAVAALIHDVIIVLGAFSLLGAEFDLPVLAAILAVIGYSLNDTIVVYDRIRENFRNLRKAAPIDVVNTSLNQTLSRTLMTSLTTLLVLIALFVFGGEMIHAFALALIIGVVVGTYSSMYVASVTAIALGVTKEDLMPVQKEGGDEVDSLP